MRPRRPRPLLSRMRLPRLLLVAALPALAGCSTLGSTLGAALTPQRTVINHDIPMASDLDAASTRKLFLLLVDGLRKSGKSRAALAFLADYDRLYPGDDEARLLRADCLFDIRDYAGAGRAYQELAGGARAAAAHAGLGRIAAAQRAWPRAVAQFAQATRLAPADPSYVNDYGFALVRTGDYARGLDVLRQATQLDPGSRTARNNLILGLTLAGRSGEAANLVETIGDPALRRDAEALLRVRVADNEPAASGAIKEKLP